MADRTGTTFNLIRRRFLGLFAAGAGAAAIGGSRVAAAQESGADDLRFPGDPAEHKIVFQFNKGDPDYHNHVLFSVGAVLRKYGDNVKIVVVAFAEGIHILGKHPRRPVSEEIKMRVSSLAQYGVEFHACGNTLKSLGWTEDDLLPFAQYVEVGAADLMELQEQGFAYVSW
jgi:intracellular sulfur oxidation DsrE/DsrF family protein